MAVKKVPQKRKYKKKSNGKNKVGVLPKYKTRALLQAKINKYFNSDVKLRKILIGKAPNQTLVEIPVPTITGLAYYLGFESRQSFYDYEKDKLFSYTIKRARLFIEVEYEEQLQYGNVTGAIFALKNMGWIDRIDTKHSGEIGVIGEGERRARELENEARKA